MPWELPDVLDPDLAREGWEQLQTLARPRETTAGIQDEHLRVTALSSCWYMRNQLLRDTDWASMAHSLEVRTPLVTGRFFAASRRSLQHTASQRPTWPGLRSNRSPTIS
jgi:hypothetical protein